MPDFNMPPGVSVNDIPGNRPEDLADEKFWDELLAREDVPSGQLPEEWWDDEGICKLVNIACDMGYNFGFAEGKAEFAMEQLDKQDESQ